MIQAKNKLMIYLSGFGVLLSFVVHIIGRNSNLFAHHEVHTMGVDAYSTAYLVSLNILLVFPLLLWLVGVYLFISKQQDHQFIPLLLTVTLTFSSISIIAGSGGGVEFHFSIFMVAATIAYYENVVLIWTMTALFAVQHFGGYLWFPEIVFGSMDTSLTMLLIHVIFLLLTSAATVLQIHSKIQITKVLEAEKSEKQNQLLDVLSSVKTLSNDLEQTSAVVSTKSDTMIRMNEQMNHSFQEVSTAIITQSESIGSIERNLQDINGRIVQTSSSSNEIKIRATYTGEIMTVNDLNMQALFQQIVFVSESIESAKTTISHLNESSQKIERILSTVREVADQTRLLALNAAIEAARAGEAGKGFSVVASEIRKLSERTSESTLEIQSILSMIQDESTASFKQIEEGKQATELSVTKASETLSSFERMSEDIKQTIHLVNELDIAIREIETGSKKISYEISNMSAVTEESAASIEQLIAISDEQTSSAKNVDSELMHLKSISESLYQRLLA